MSKKIWKCLNCGHVFETSWIPFHLVKCPKCGSNMVYRIDSMRGICQ